MAIEAAINHELLLGIINPFLFPFPEAGMNGDQTKNKNNINARSILEQAGLDLPSRVGLQPGCLLLTYDNIIIKCSGNEKTANSLGSRMLAAWFQRVRTQSA